MQQQIVSTTIVPTEQAFTPLEERNVPLAAIEMHEVSKQFRLNVAVHSLSLRVKQGEIFGLLAPNGSGKTTTINMITGLIAPTSGHIQCFGYDVRQKASVVRRLMGVVPQETALYEELSAWDNMEFHANLFGIPWREQQQRIRAMLELVQLADRKNSRVGTFSGGMKHRLGIARALLHEPRLLILDEPTTGVDPHAREAIWSYIRHLPSQGRTVFMTTNVLQEAEELCDRVAILDRGRLVVVDSPTRLRENYGGTVITLSLAELYDQDALLRGLRKMKGVSEAVVQEQHTLSVRTQGSKNLLAEVVNMTSRSCVIQGIEYREANLNEVFMRLTGNALRD